MKTKKILSLVLVCVMALALAVPAFATDDVVIGTAGETGTTRVDLTVTAATFSVTVPTSLPVEVAANGTVSVSDTAKIVNNSNGAVKVTNVAVTAAAGWTLIDYTDNLKGEAVGTQKIALQLFGVSDVTENGTALAAAIGTGGVIAANGNADITYNANIPPQANPISADTQVASVVFTIGWNTAS